MEWTPTVEDTLRMARGYDFSGPGVGLVGTERRSVPSHLSSSHTSGPLILSGIDVAGVALPSLTTQQSGTR